MSLACIDKIIGLSRTSCPCYESDKPSTANESSSGLYIDELENISLKMVNSVSPCEKGGLWNLMDLARENAIKAFETDLLACISSVTKIKRKSFTGFIGERDWTTLVDPKGSKIGWKIVSPNIEGAFFRIKSITTLMDSTATFDINMYSNIDDGVIHTFSGIESESIKRKENDVADKVFPLFDKKCGDEIIYYLLFEPSGFKPLNNILDCGCGSKSRNYQNFFQVDGVYGEDPDTLSGQKQFVESSNEANGLCVDMDVYCTIQDVICQHTIDPSDPIFMTMAFAVNFKAGELLIDLINASGNINRYTLLGQEKLWGRRSKFGKEYRTRIAYLCGEIDVSDSDCISCKNKTLNMHTVRA